MMIDIGGDRVDTIALTVAVFASAAPRDRDRPLDVTHVDIPSCPHADLPTLVITTKSSVKVSILGVGRGGTTIQRDSRLLKVGCGDANEQVTVFGGSSAARLLPVRFLPNASGVHEACIIGMAILSTPVHVICSHNVI